MYPVIIPNPVPVLSPPVNNSSSTGNISLYRDKRQLFSVQRVINTQPRGSGETIPHVSQVIASANTNNNTNAVNSTAKHPTESLPPVSSAKATMFPGLTLFLPMKSAMKTKADNCPLMAMFESCTRSRKFLKILSTLSADQKEWLSLLHVDELFICSGRAKRLRHSKENAATQALVMLQKFQPVHYKSREEMCLRNDEIITGLTLYLSYPNPGGMDCLQSLTESCVQCKLELTLWHDKGEVFGATHATVLLINAKPICLATGKDLDGAKRTAARRAVSILKVNHPVVIVNKAKRHESTSKSHLLTPPDMTTEPIDPSQAGQSAIKQSPLSTTPVSIKDDLPPGPEKLNQPDAIVLEPEQPQSAATGKVEPNQLQSTITRKINFRTCSSSTLYVTETFVPKLTLYLPKDGHDKNAHVTLKRSAAYSDLHLRINNIGWVEKYGKSVVASALLIGDSVVAWGFGDSEKASRDNISWSSALDMLMRSSPVKYYHSNNALKRMASQTKMSKNNSNAKRKYKDSKELVNNLMRRTDNDRRTDSESDDEEQSSTEDNEKPDNLFVVSSEWIGSEPGDEEETRDCDKIIQMHIQEIL